MALFFVPFLQKKRVRACVYEKKIVILRTFYVCKRHDKDIRG